MFGSSEGVLDGLIFYQNFEQGQDATFAVGRNTASVYAMKGTPLPGQEIHLTDNGRFIGFMLGAIEDALLKNAPVIASVNAPVNIGGMKTPDAILVLVQQNKFITRKDMAAQMEKDIRTVARAIKKLQEAGRLKRVGSDKTGHRELL
ncbi:hypothetical protein SCARR_02735 [Pontiella sulfatireligans]|uniref:Uncharacterized protein n=1 Tax=Pontiella sulfatireligans TaxID=2750658 RepID=A0A6C2UL27_9BACT|nr:hypothetical protein SCARR_02735 [Pontiella sulfatireligans]